MHIESSIKVLEHIRFLPPEEPALNNPVLIPEGASKASPLLVIVITIFMSVCWFGCRMTEVHVHIMQPLPINVHVFPVVVQNLMINSYNS